MQEDSAQVRSRLLAVVAIVAGTASQVWAQAAAPVAWRDVLEQPTAWYSSDEARRLADNVLQYQRDSGGWPKDIDMTRSPSGPPPARPDATIDNGATTTQIRFLSQVWGQTGVRPGSDRGQTGVRPLLASALRGIDYLLAAQYPNGGWPQFFPLRTDYSRHITFNDNAMINAASLLEEVAAGRAPFGYVDDERRTRAANAVRRAVEVILKTQITVHGTLTAWCAQHDAVTLEPRPARAYEHISVSGSETVGIVRFLMRQPRTPAIERAVDAAVAWLRAVRLPEGQWARFYEIGTNRPIFSGRDGVIRYELSEIEQERRDGYAWLGTWPKNLVEGEYRRWREGE